MATHFTWICHAATAAMRAGVFPADEPIDEKGAAQAAALAPSLPKADNVRISPARRCMETARALGLTGAVDPALRDCDYGRWAGRSLADINREDEKALQTWLADPAAAPHGGEALTGLIGRIAAWLDAQRDTGRTIIVTHPNVIRAAVIHVIDAPPAAFSRLDVAPLSLTTFSRHNEKWRLSLGGLHDRNASAAGP